MFRRFSNPELLEQLIIWALVAIVVIGMLAALFPDAAIWFQDTTGL